MKNKKTSSPRALIAIVSEHTNFVVGRLVNAYQETGLDLEFVGWDRHKKMPRTTENRSVKCSYIMRGWGYANWSLICALPLWCLRLFWFILWHDATVVHAVDFDSALPATLAGLFRKVKVIYDIQDNFEERHRFPGPLKSLLSAMNKWVARRSAEIIVVDRNRIVGGLVGQTHKISIVPNCPPDMNNGAVHEPHHGRLVVSAFGVYLSPMRGIGLLVDAAAKVPGVKILAAGRLVDAGIAQKIKSSPHVEYLGMLSQEESLRRTSEADIVFAFYDPSIPINRRANSAKWFDAMMAGRPVLSNSEIINAPWIEDTGFGFTCDYSEDRLVEMLLWLRDHPEELSARGLRARSLFETEYNRETMNQRVRSAMQRAIGSATTPTSLLAS